MPKKVAKDKAIKDKEWAKEVIERDDFHCQVCKRENLRLNSHHLIPREFIQWRWSLDNGMALCVHCHTLGKYSAHKNPIWFCNWLVHNRQDIIYLILDRLPSIKCSNEEGLTEV